MGANRGLTGPTCKTLSVWLQARRRAQEDIILHECTPRFDAQTLKQHLGDIYEFYSLPLPSEVISPHHLGWPVQRPRRYTIGVKRGRVQLGWSEFEEDLKKLLMAASVDCRVLYQATPEEERKHKTAMANSHCKASVSDSFFDLLPTSKKHRVKAYMELPKIRSWLDEGKEVAVNLEQRPHTFPTCNYLCPTLLRGASMWLLRKGVPLAGEDLLTMMGIPMPSRRSMHGQNLLLSPFPIELTERNIKSLTGNAMHCAVVGCLLLCILKHLKTCDT